MVEVHHPWRKRSATVLARSPPQISQELERRRLTDANALDFLLAIGRVISDVVRTLIASALHKSQLEHLFTSCQWDSRLNATPAGWLRTELTNLPASL